MIIIALLYGR